MNKVVKLSRLTVYATYPIWDKNTNTLKLGVTSQAEARDTILNKFYGKIIRISVKQHKKKVLVKGEVNCHFKDDRSGIWYDWYFKPFDEKNAKKLLFSHEIKTDRYDSFFLKG